MDEQLKQALYWVKELRDRLVEMQCSSEGGTEVTSWGCCPMCGSADFRGHREGCDLNKQIQDVDAFLASVSASRDEEKV